MMQRHQVGKIRKAFTLIEMLVVLLIIGILAAILFPVLQSARESGYQASCATNLHQIYLAVELYKTDEGGYPPNLQVLLPNTEELAGGKLNTDGKGYFKGGKDGLICSDDDTESTGLRSSYGDVGNPSTNDFGNYVWNYWGYRSIKNTAFGLDSTAICTGTAPSEDVSGCLGTAYPTEADFNTMLAKTDTTNPFLQNRYAITPDGTELATAAQTDPTQIDVTKLPMLANRFAPPNTIITHCVFHRLPTSNVGDVSQIYSDAADGHGARDIILRLDGTTKVMDVTTDTFTTKDGWALQNF